MSSSTLSYRREVDGLRAVAVLPVILFHAGFKAFSGGFVGVDVFFVISGYLITTIILREQREGRFSILTFYERRARRILPALFVVIAACVPFALAWMLPWQLIDFGQSLAAVSLFSSNVLFWLQSGYFEPAAELKPLLHTWSLAVEEQYYVLFPLLLLALAKRRLRDVAIVLGLGALASLALTEWGWRREPTANFYLLPMRAWELLAGSLLAVYLMGRDRPTGWRAEAGAGVGVVMIVAAILLFSEATPFPSLWALVPVVGSVLVIFCAGPANWTGRILGWGPMVGVGLISYSAYLWHQPLFAFARIRSIETPTPALMAGLAALALVLAWLTWRFVETPFRDRARVSRKRIFVGSAVGIIGFVGAAVGLTAFKGLPQRLGPDVLRIAAYGESDPGQTRNCLPLPGDLSSFCAFNPELENRVAIWGDSHAMAVAPSLAKELATRQFGLIALGKPACTPILGVSRPSFRTCPEHNQEVMRFLMSPKGPDTVVLVSRWTKPFIGMPFDNREGGVEIDEPSIFFPAGSPTAQPLAPDEVAVLARKTIQMLLDADKRVIIVGNVPEAGWNVPSVLARMAQFGDGGRRPLTTSAAVVRARSDVVNRAFAPLGVQPGLTVIDPAPLFCDRPLVGRCLNEWRGSPLYRDDDHVSDEGASWVTERIIRAIDGPVELPPLPR